MRKGLFVVYLALLVALRPGQISANRTLFVSDINGVVAYNDQTGEHKVKVKTTLSRSTSQMD